MRLDSFHFDCTDVDGARLLSNQILVNHIMERTTNSKKYGILQSRVNLQALLQTLHAENYKREHPKPILLKIAPDLTDTQLLDIIDIVSKTNTDGVIATNTTIARDGLQSDSAICAEKGGLSGKPLSKRSTDVIRFLNTNSKGSFPIIGVGGIHTPQDAIDKLEAGASLLQIYTGFVYEGPGMVKRILKAL